MTIHNIASMLAKKEGKRSQARIGDLREVLAILSDMIFEDPEIKDVLISNGIKRAKKRKAK